MKQSRKLMRLCAVISLFVAPAFAEDGEIHLNDTIKGSSEQPRVLHIVPWQQPGDRPEIQRSVGAEVDQLFQLIDRTSFKRELRYVEFLGSEDQRSAASDLFD